LGIATLVPNGSAATGSAHLTPAAWRGLNLLFSKKVPSTVRGCASRVGEPSADPEVGGLQGLCIDEVEAGAWIGRFVAGCLGIQDGPGATEASCRADIVGVDSNAAALAAWERWFAARLEAGGCRTIFSSLAMSADRLAAAGRPLVRALSGSNNAAVSRAFHEWLRSLHSEDNQTAAQKRTVRAEIEACRPPSGATDSVLAAWLSPKSAQR
jgi:hypothetical protein